MNIDIEKIGVMSPLREDGSAGSFPMTMGLTSCQVATWDMELLRSDVAKRTKKSAIDHGVGISGFWCGWPGPMSWDFLKGPETLGIVPKEFRDIRVQVLRKGGQFTVDLGAPALITHLGFLPENPTDPEFNKIVDLVGELALFYQSLGIEFWFETGQETPITLKRLISAVGTTNLGVNLDPANLLLYGKANPVDSIDVFENLIKNVHAKDGFYPTDPMKLGEEVPVGKGLVNFPLLTDRLEREGYKGEYIIEREIEGPKQLEDVKSTIHYLNKGL